MGKNEDICALDDFCDRIRTNVKKHGGSCFVDIVAAFEIMKANIQAEAPWFESAWIPDADVQKELTGRAEELGIRVRKIKTLKAALKKAELHDVRYLRDLRSVLTRTHAVATRQLESVNNVLDGTTGELCGGFCTTCGARLADENDGAFCDEDCEQQFVADGGDPLSDKPQSYSKDGHSMCRKCETLIADGACSPSCCWNGTHDDEEGHHWYLTENGATCSKCGTVIEDGKCGPTCRWDGKHVTPQGDARSYRKQGNLFCLQCDTLVAGGRLLPDGGGLVGGTCSPSCLWNGKHKAPQEGK